MKGAHPIHISLWKIHTDKNCPSRRSGCMIVGEQTFLTIIVKMSSGDNSTSWGLFTGVLTIRTIIWKWPKSSSHSFVSHAKHRRHQPALLLSDKAVEMKVPSENIAILHSNRSIISWVGSLLSRERQKRNAEQGKQAGKTLSFKNNGTQCYQLHLLQ